MIVLYIFLLLILSIYSYSLVDPNITLINSPLWTSFRNSLVYFGYYQRQLSWILYLILIVSLFVFYFYFIKNAKKINPLKLALFIGVVLLLSYPFLSHDFFNYLFDAKIFTFYGKNPYFFKGLDFPNDPWLRFMHWTHRAYPYGPVFLLITLAPSFLSFGKFILAFLFFKITGFLFYFLAVYYLNKLSKRLAIIFATNPLIIIEGLINSHNDLIATSLAITGVYYLFKKKHLMARIALVLSAGIKYITLPLIFVTRKNKKINLCIVVILCLILLYLSLKTEIQPWYFLAIFALLPLYEKLISRFNIFFAGLLLSYYPYIRLGGWDSVEKLQLKHIIIIIFLMINCGCFLLHKIKYGAFKKIV